MWVNLFPPSFAAEKPQALPRGERWLPWALMGAALLVLFVHLGSASLFEPDEGRNAEKAREILVLRDWITPHENFYPVLDKPIFFYWLIALAYQIFGISEWAARLPSALAALGCLGLIYRFARRHWGRWEALWGAWILLSSGMFFAFARVVIFDMALTFFLTVALCAFYEAGQEQNTNRRRLFCMLLYGSLAAATLTKGLVGVILPGMIFFAYLCLTRRWSILRNIHLVPGTLAFIIIVIPWYLQADAANPGYLRYYLWEEHFGRFTDSEFKREAPWHYFIWVFLGGIFPWTFIAPLAVARYRKLALDDKTIYLILWFALPLLFFSLSTAKLPHYILPIFPPAAILLALGVVNLLQVYPSKTRLILSIMALCQAAIVLYVVFGSLWPAVLPRALRYAMPAHQELLWGFGAIVVGISFFFVKQAQRRPYSDCGLYLMQLTALALFLLFSAKVMVVASPARSAKELAEIAQTVLTPSTQLVFYDTYRSGLPFYLRLDKPIWMVTHSEKKRTFLGNFYALGDEEEPANQWGKALLDFEEFQERWEAAKEPLLIIVKQHNLSRLVKQIGASASEVGRAGEYLVLSKL